MKYPPNFWQSLDEPSLRRLPPFCTYEGDDEELAHLVGKLIPTLDVEKVVYVGERDNVWCDNPSGDPEDDRIRPWAGIQVVELGPDGKPIPETYEIEPLPDEVDPALEMWTDELGSLGMTDDDLARMAQELLGETWEPEGPGRVIRKLRRALYDRVMAAATA